MSESDSNRNLVGPLAFILAINLAMIIVGAKYDDPDLCKGQVKNLSGMSASLKIWGGVKQCGKHKLPSLVEI